MRKSLFCTLDFHPETRRSLVDVYDAAHEHVLLAEDLKFECMWLGEHHFQNLGTIPNPSVLLASLARSTKHIRLGPAVAVLPMRNATLIAEDYAMLDVISGGRLNMGVGSGSQLVEYERMGVDFENRRKVFEETLSKLKAYWNNSNGSLTELNVHPVQRPTPPLYVATTSPDHAYHAGLQGDSLLTIVSPIAEDLSGLKRIIDAHSRGLFESEANCLDAEFVVTVFAHAAESNSEALATAALSIGRFVKLLSGQRVPNAEALCQAMVDRNTGLFGTVEQIAKQLDDYRELGVEHISFLNNFGGMESGRVQESIKHLGSVI